MRGGENSGSFDRGAAEGGGRGGAVLMRHGGRGKEKDYCETKEEEEGRLLLRDLETENTAGKERKGSGGQETRKQRGKRFLSVSSAPVSFSRFRRQFGGAQFPV